MTTAAPPDLSAAAEERGRLLARTAEVYRVLHEDGRDGPTMPFGDRMQLVDEVPRLQSRYYEILPRVTLGACPICGAPVVQAFDPWGLDGFWWLETRAGPKPGPTACEHLRLVSGAVGLNGRPPRGSPFDSARPGPEVPFVIPALLAAEPTMAAVVSSVPMRPGYTAYPIAYFSEKAPDPPVLVPWWTRVHATTPNGPGGYGWTITTHPWDFELRPWVEQGKVRWIDPADRARTLSTKPPREFPFGDLPGERSAQVIRGDERRLEPPPAGQPVNPFSE